MQVRIVRGSILTDEGLQDILVFFNANKGMIEAAEAGNMDRPSGRAAALAN